MMMLLQHLYVDADDVVVVPTPCVDDADVVVVPTPYADNVQLMWLKSKHFVLMMMMLFQHFYVDGDDVIPKSLCW